MYLNIVVAIVVVVVVVVVIIITIVIIIIISLYQTRSISLLLIISSNFERRFTTLACSFARPIDYSLAHSLTHSPDYTHSHTNTNYSYVREGGRDQLVATSDWCLLNLGRLADDWR